MKSKVCLLMIVLSIIWIMPALASETTGEKAPIPPIPTPGMVTMVDLGAHKCIPCKMMAPILSELKKEYDGQASIIFIDVWQNREQGAKYGIRAIPTQIFYDNTGKEVSRHVGFMDKKSIVSQLNELGVTLEATKNAQ